MDSSSDRIDSAATSIPTNSEPTHFEQPSSKARFQATTSGQFWRLERRRFLTASVPKTVHANMEVCDFVSHTPAGLGG